MNTPLISVIAPVYKVEALLAHCLDTMRAQSYPHFELILVDDGSPDNSGAICDEYAAKDERFIVIHQKNSGVGTARNVAFDASHGTFINYIDPDDYLDPDYLKNLLDAQQLHDADLVVSRFHRHSDLDDRDVVTPARGDTCYTRGQDGFLHAVADICEDVRVYALWAKLFKRELLEGLRYDPKAVIAGDTVLMGEVLERTNTLQLSDAADYHYCERSSGTITSQRNPDLYKAYLNVHSRFCQTLQRSGTWDDEIAEALNRRLARYATRAIHSIRRGEWTQDEQRKFVDIVLVQQPLIDAVRRENERQLSEEYALLLKKDSAALLDFYAKRSRKNKMARRMPHLFAALSSAKRAVRRLGGK